MDLKIVSKKQNNLLNRIEVVASISGFSSTPSRKDVGEAMCSELKCSPDCLVIREVHQPFGSKTVKVKANVYDSLELAKKREPEFIFNRGKVKAQVQPSGA